MAKTYRGSVMALPDREEDLFAQINKRTAARREQRAIAEDEYRRMNLYSDEPVEEVSRRLNPNMVVLVVVSVLSTCIGILAGLLM